MTKYKCSCCGSEQMEVRKINSISLGSGLRIDMGNRKVKNIDRARLCLDCGNIMPFIQLKDKG